MRLSRGFRASFVQILSDRDIFGPNVMYIKIHGGFFKKDDVCCVYRDVALNHYPDFIQYIPEITVMYNV